MRLVNGIGTGAIAVSSVVAFLQSYVSLQSSLYELIENIGYMDGILLYFNKLFSFLERDWSESNRFEAGKPPQSDTVNRIVFDTVSFTYPNGVRALRRSCVSVSICRFPTTGRSAERTAVSSRRGDSGRRSRSPACWFGIRVS